MISAVGKKYDNIFIFLITRIEFLRHLRDFFGVVFKVQSLSKDEEDETMTGCDTHILLSCIGVGYSNVSKSIT
jgi:RNA 3'-terminal phosphate cyclase-like protein